MINKNELRLGNLVSCKNIKEQYVRPGYDNSFRVETIGYRGINEWQDMGASGLIKFDDLLPIKLTEQWLERAGFRNNWLELVYGMSLTYEDEEILLGGFGSSAGSQYFVVPCKYVHQLQNIYAITGQELEFKPIPAINGTTH